MPGKKTVPIKLIWDHSTDRVVEGGPFVLVLRNAKGEQAFLANSFQSREEAVTFIKTKSIRAALNQMDKWKSYNIVDMRKEEEVENYRTREEAEASHRTKQ